MSRKHRSPIWKVDDLEFERIIKGSKTYTDALFRFGLKSHGGNHLTLKNRISSLGIDVSHLRDGAKRINKDTLKRINTPIPLEDILTHNSTYCRYHLKKRLIKSGLLENICYECGQLPEWNGKSLVMVLDHINGVNDDNVLSNLRLLCPNCNSQTDTFSGRKRKA